jgi:hypothetical protein
MNCQNWGRAVWFFKEKKERILGQEVVVTKQTASRVHISYRDASGRPATQMKHPSSMVLLEEGLHVVQDARGFVWVKRGDTGAR